MSEKRSLIDLGGYKPGRSVIHKDEIRLKPSPREGVYVGKVICPENGFNHATTSLDIYHLPPNANTVAHRHDDALMHVLTGSGYSIIDDIRYEWERGDTIHIKPGIWHQHWNTSNKAANMLVARSVPLMNHIKPGRVGTRDDSFIEVGDYVPDHPFGLGQTEIRVGDGGDVKLFEQLWAEVHGRWAKRMRDAETIMKGKDVRWERASGQRGEFNAMLADYTVGFDTRLVSMGIQTLPRGGRNETHAHQEAIVYVLSGRGSAVVEDETFDLEEGDCVFVHANQWHQFCADSSEPKPFTQMRVLAVDLTEFYLFPFPYIEERDGKVATELNARYVPRLPWNA